MKFLQYTMLHLSRMLKNKRVIIISILLPVIVLNIVAKITQGQNTSNESVTNIDIVNEDKGQMGKALEDVIRDVSGIYINENNIGTATRRVENNDSSLAIVIPKNFTSNLEAGKEPEITLLKIKVSNMDLTLRNKINTFIGSNLLINNAEKLQTSNVKIDYTKVKETMLKDMKEKKVDTKVDLIKNDDKVPLSQAMSIGLIVSFMMYTMSYIVVELIELKKNGTLRRSIATPNKTFVILGSVFAAFMLIGLIQITLIILSTKLLFNVSWGNSIVTLYIVYTALIMVVLSLGILITRFISSPHQASMLVPFIVTATCMVSGCFTPLEYLPDIIKKIAIFTPQYWAYTAFKAIVLQGKGISAIIVNVAILLLFSTAFFTAGAISLRQIADPS